MSGHYGPRGSVTCPVCDGSGEVPTAETQHLADRGGGYMRWVEFQACGVCGGSGAT